MRVPEGERSQASLPKSQGNSRGREQCAEGRRARDGERYHETINSLHLEARSICFKMSLNSWRRKYACRVTPQIYLKVPIEGTSVDDTSRCISKAPC